MAGSTNLITIPLASVKRLIRWVVRNPEAWTMGDRKNKIVVLLDGLAEHPAFLAWKMICPSSTPPVSIEVLKSRWGRRDVYRLRGVTGAAGPVIAKQGGVGKLFREAQIYTDVFPALSLPVVECYGYFEEFDGKSWLFLEDAGEVPYSPKNIAHWPLVIRWMARLHSTPTEFVSNLRDTGPAHFRSVLQEAKQGVRSSLTHPSIGDSSIGPFEALLGHLDVIENGWAYVEQACSGVPQTLVHGDFVPKNVRVRGEWDDAHLLVIDWEMSGAAPPAEDIAMIPGGRPERRAYFEILKETWPRLAWEEVERLHRIGQIFRLLHYVQWETWSFAYTWIERTQRKMLIYQKELHDLVQDGRWLKG